MPLRLLLSGEFLHVLFDMSSLMWSLLHGMSRLNQGHLSSNISTISEPLLVKPDTPGRKRAHRVDLGAERQLE
jgi:hypothetical protein